jgi:uncharacterized protein YbaA (DUF1428 family)
MYVQGFVIPVKEENKEAYRQLAEDFWPIARDYGAISQVECWEADIKDGKQTDFRRAVALEPGEKVVFSWVLWPDRATADASQEQMMQDERMQAFGEDMPFDGKRMVFGGFDPIVWQGDK